MSTMPALHTPLPSVKEETFVAGVDMTTNITTLDSGLKVATIDARGNSSSVGVFVDTGSRDEDYLNSGSSHLLQHTAFKSTKTKTAFRRTREAERLGATVMATSLRELVLFTGDVVRPKACDLLEMLSESVTAPAMHPWEVKEGIESASEELADLDNNPVALVTEQLHSAAFYGNSLGKPLYVSKAQLATLDADTLSNFWSSQVASGSLCVSAVNVDHDEMVSLSAELFAGLPATPAQPREAATYTGGEFRMTADTPLTTVAMGFQGASWGDDKLVHVALLNSLMGGGSSFSAGGPGKGMYSRLYRNVLASYEEVESANVYNMFYTDSGLFGVHGQTHPSWAGHLIDVLTKELHKMAESISADDLARSKNHLKSSVLMNLEQREVMVDDMARQVLAYSNRVSGEEMCAKIDAVTEEEVMKVAASLLKSPLTFVGHGDLRHVPRYDDMASRF